MSREIKFRAWTHQNPPMPWSQKAVAITGEGEQMLPIGGIYTGVWHAFNNAADGGLIIEQFTGLKDKNGREIYEGDIVNIQGIKYYVDFEHGGFWFNNDNRKWKANRPFTHFLEINDAEVIGNIHENPELLGGEE